MEHTSAHMADAVVHILSTALKDWGSVHPLIVHFPIALLFVAPLLILGDMIFKDHSKTLYRCALFIMALGLISILLAISSGEAASEAITQPAREVVETLGAHDEMAHRSRNVFGILTAVFAVYVFGQAFLQRFVQRPFHILLLIIYLAFYSYGLLVLSYTAHHGGKLVHDHQITSTLFK